MDPSPEVTFKTAVLHKLRVAAAGSAAGEVLRGSKVDVHFDYLAQRLVAQIETELLADKLDHGTWRIVEPWHYPTWVDQFHAGLPEGTFRRRFMDLFRECGPQMKRKVHEIEYNAYASFPEDKHYYPQDLARPRVFAVMDTPSYWEYGSPQ